VSRVLVIDDDECIRTLLREVLEPAGHQVLEAGEGQAGVRLLRRYPVDLVFCDLFMPGQEGLETIRIIHRERPDVLIAAISGGGSTGSIDLLEVALKFGATVALRKPLVAAEVLALAASPAQACAK
jgi:CheY-like chemotaxis protein